MIIHRSDIFGLVKTATDVHTLGISACDSILQACGLRTFLSDNRIERALEKINSETNQEIVLDWIIDTRISHISYSYRLDPHQGLQLFTSFMIFLRHHRLLKEHSGPIKTIAFAGLPDTCKLIQERFGDRVILFIGEETPLELLKSLSIPETLFPNELVGESKYDKVRYQLANDILKADKYREITGYNDPLYQGYGTLQDSLIKRLDNRKGNSNLPIIRAHVGPYNEKKKEAIDLFCDWTKTIAQSGVLDVLSIGTSQLSQSMFEQNWNGRLNGGGVPVQTTDDYIRIYEAARPMLVRSYAGTKNLPFMAEIHEKSLNIAWHAFSFWWFNVLDGRGELSLEDNLDQTFSALQYVSTTNKPVEANVPHHFAFRGSDDLSYIVSNYLAAAACKKSGIRTFVVQNMLNTPKLTWGIQDIAKSRAMMKIVRSLESRSFRIIFETRAGLSYFSSDLDKAKRQLASVTMLMDDLEITKPQSPEIIHVVSYSEAQYLADPSVVIDSVKLTLHTLLEYRKIKQENMIISEMENESITNRTNKMIIDAWKMIDSMEKTIPNLYSPSGFSEVFKQGWFPVPQLWAEREKYPKAVNWNVRFQYGGYNVVDSYGIPMSMEERLDTILSSQRII